MYTSQDSIFTFVMAPPGTNPLVQVRSQPYKLKEKREVANYQLQAGTAVSSEEEET